MNNKTIRKKWTKDGLNYLKKAYLQGLPLKQIASTLNRTISAINKILKRYKLRTERRKRHSSSHSLISSPQQTHITRTSKPKKRPKPEKSLSRGSRHWVSFERVVAWLRSQKISVIKSKSDNYYELNGLPKTKQQVLLFANKLRDEQHLPVFFVPGVTNS